MPSSNATFLQAHLVALVIFSAGFCLTYCKKIGEPQNIIILPVVESIWMVSGHLIRNLAENKSR